MKLEFLITESFDNDIKKLSAGRQSKIKSEINLVSDSLLNGRTSFMKRASMPYSFNLKGGLDSSLYVLRVDNEKRMVVAVDEDPIFDKISLTMFRLVNNDEAEKAYREIGEQLYKSMGML